MTRLIIEDLPELGRAVLDRVREALSTAGDQRIEALADQVPTFPGSDPIRLVTTGEYDAGKSSLLKALTGVDIFISSDIATSEARSYEWGDVLLVDTPGVGTNRPPHDEAAEQALLDADLVLFVLSVDLFDDITGAHLRHVAIDLGKLDQTVIVINKAATMSADPALRYAAITQALGFEPSCPIIECDARSALQARQADPARVARLEKVGNLAALEDALNDLVRRSARAGRLKQPFQAALANIAAADGLLVPDSDEEALGALLERWREVLQHSTTRLDDATERAYRTVQEQVLDAGEDFIAAAAEGRALGPAQKAFELAANECVGGLPDLIQSAFDTELEQLAREEEALALGPEFQRLADSLIVSLPDLPTSLAPGNDLTSGFLDAVGGLAKEHGRSWLTKALKEGSAPGTPMHSLVREVGHRLQHRYKPHGIVKATKRLNIALTAGVVLFDIYSPLRQAHVEERQAREQEAKLRVDITAWTDELINAARAEVAPIVHQFAAEAAKPADEIGDRLARVEQNRTRTTEALQQLRRDCDAALATLEPSAGQA